MIALPTLETERMRLVAPSAAHIAGFVGFYTSARAEARGWACMPHEAWRHFAVVLGHHILRGFGPFVALSRDDGRALGMFGPWHPEGQAEAEIKWTLWSGADEGKGLATEAARATRDYAYRVLGWSGAASYIAIDNIASQSVATRLGASQDGIWTTPRGTAVQVWRHPRPDSVRTDAGQMQDAELTQKGRSILTAGGLNDH